MKTLIGAILVLAVCTPSAFARKWTDSTGKYTVEAELVDIKDGKVRLRKEDGSVIAVPLDWLSEADRAFANSQALKNNSAQQQPKKTKPSVSRTSDDAAESVADTDAAVGGSTTVEPKVGPSPLPSKLPAEAAALKGEWFVDLSLAKGRIEGGVTILAVGSNCFKSLTIEDRQLTLCYSDQETTKEVFEYEHKGISEDGTHAFGLGKRVSSGKEVVKNGGTLRLRTIKDEEGAAVLDLSGADPDQRLVTLRAYPMRKRASRELPKMGKPNPDAQVNVGGVYFCGPLPGFQKPGWRYICFFADGTATYCGDYVKPDEIRAKYTETLRVTNGNMTTTTYVWKGSYQVQKGHLTILVKKEDGDELRFEGAIYGGELHLRKGQKSSLKDEGVYYFKALPQ